MELELFNALNDTLTQHGIKPEDAYDTLNEFLQLLNDQSWETCKISLNLVYMLKDLIWWNLEHLPQHNETLQPTLQYLGSKYPQIAALATQDIYVEPNDVVPLLGELDDVINRWEPTWKIIQLHTSNRGELTTATVLSLHTSSKEFNYYVGHSALTNVVNCTQEGQVGEFQTANILRNTLYTLRDAATKANASTMGIRLEI